MEDTPGILIFLGRFHALVVHLPIGFVCLALLIEFFFKNPTYKPLINFTWLLAALSATASVVLGYFLSLQGGYDEQTLGWHKWAGISLAVIIHVCYFLKKYATPKKVTRYAVPVSLGICTLLLILTGHYGGSLTHGGDYLTEYKPASVAELFGASSEQTTTAKKITSLDSADIFADAVMPIFKAKCVSCHNMQKKKGELILTSFADLMKGGKEGAAVVAGSIEKSSIYQRITLPADDKKFMPAEGKKPLTAQQIAIIKWWIEKQAPASAKITALQPDSAMRKTFITYFGITANNSSTLNEDVAPANSATIQELNASGFQVIPLAEKSNLLQATFNGIGKNTIDVTKLVALKDQLVWLRINHAGKLDDALSSIGTLVNLRKLMLNDNEITDEKLDGLLPLSKLEYLNLYNTKVSATGIEKLMKLKNLKQLYVGATGIDSLIVNKLIVQYPQVKIVYKDPE